MCTRVRVCPRVHHAVPVRHRGRYKTVVGDRFPFPWQAGDENPKDAAESSPTAEVRLHYPLYARGTWLLQRSPHLTSGCVAAGHRVILRDRCTSLLCSAQELL